MNNDLNDSRIIHLIEEAVREDLGMGDVTTGAIVPSGLIGRGDIRAKEDGVIAGLETGADSLGHAVAAAMRTRLE